MGATRTCHIFVGTYPNDRATIEVVAQIAATDAAGRLTLVVNESDGPTTKADCLNQLWRSLLRWEAQQGARASAIILHDAEDVVHRDALRLMGWLAPRFALIQLPGHAARERSVSLDFRTLLR